MTRLSCQQYEAKRLRSQHILALITFSTLADICQIGLVQLCCHQVRSHARFIIGQIRSESGHTEHKRNVKILELLQRAPAACALLQKACTLVGLGRPMGKDRGIY